jgi:hypothetical protein
VSARGRRDAAIRTDGAAKPTDGAHGALPIGVGHEVGRAAVGAAEESKGCGATHPSLGLAATAKVARRVW